MARLIERFGGVAHVSPSLREVPIAENREAIDFANRLITGHRDTQRPRALASGPRDSVRPPPTRGRVR